jgi:lysophospholipase L1-like esterase
MKRKIQLLAIAVAAIVLVASIATLTQIVGRGNTAKRIRVACIGDSITRGSGYPAKLQLLLGSNYDVGNFGVDGSTVSLKSSIPYMNQPAYQNALDFDPDIVVIMLGTNDAKPSVMTYNGTFEDDYTTLVSSFQRLDSKPQVYIAESPPVQNSSKTVSASDFSQTVLPDIQDVAQNLSLPIIDVYDAFQNHSDFFMDGVHPDSDGATLIACDVAIAITPDGQPAQP